MKREEILERAQREGRQHDLPDREAQRNGAWAAYILGVLLMIIVDTVNGFVLHYVNRGADFVLFTMVFALFLTKYLKLRKKHELVITIFWGVLSLFMLAVWILQLTGVL